MFEEDLRPYGAHLELHHYTSYSGLLGILSTNHIWATEARFLNDPTELSYGAGICDRALNLITEPRFRPFVDSVRAGLAHRFGNSVYVACVSEACDISSQWEKYADRGRGFAISFDNRCLTDLSAGGPGSPVRIMPVEYRLDRQKARAEAAVVRAITDLGRIEQGRSLTMYDAHSRFTLLGVELVFMSVTFKEPLWSSEREYRILYLSDGARDGLPILWRKSGQIEVPYVEIDLTCTYHGPHPIYAAIREGPSVRPEIAFMVKRFLGEDVPFPWIKQRPF